MKFSLENTDLLLTVSILFFLLKHFLSFKNPFRNFHYLKKMVSFKFENVQYVDRCNPKVKLTGNLHLTSSHLVYIDSISKREIWVYWCFRKFLNQTIDKNLIIYLLIAVSQIYYSLISSVDKQSLNITGSPILIRCKHYLTCLFIISKERDCQTLYSTLINYSRPSLFMHFFPS